MYLKQRAPRTRQPRDVLPLSMELPRAGLLAAYCPSRGIETADQVTGAKPQIGSGVSSGLCAAGVTARFDGSANAYLGYGNNPFHGATAFSALVSFVSDTGADARLVSAWSSVSAERNALPLAIGSSGELAVALRRDDGAILVWVTAGGAVTPGKLHTAAVSAIGGEVPTVCLDGINLPTTRTAGDSDTWTIDSSTSTTLRIGADKDGGLSLGGDVALAIVSVGLGWGLPKLRQWTANPWQLFAPQQAILVSVAPANAPLGWFDAHLRPSAWF